MLASEGRASGPGRAGKRVRLTMPMCIYTGLMALASKLGHPQCSAPATQQNGVLCHHGCLLAVSKPNFTQTACVLCNWWGKKLWREAEMQRLGTSLGGGAGAPSLTDDAA